MTANYDEDDQQRRRSQRRPPNGAHPRASSSRVSGSGGGGGGGGEHGSSSNSSGRRRPPSSSSACSSRSVDSSGGGGDAGRSSARSGADRDARAPAARRGRRAPTASSGNGSAPRRSKSDDLNDYGSSELSVDMGYGDTVGADMGYGDATPDLGYGDATPDTAKGASGEKPVRSRRQRRCSIAEVTSSSLENASSEGGGEPDYGYGAPSGVADRPRLQKNASGDFSTVGVSNSTISNIAIPMAEETAPKRKNRRGSMFGAITRNVNSSAKEPEQPEKTKKPGADRDRRRQGTLLDRVGAGSDARGSRSGPSGSYSDRILTK